MKVLIQEYNRLIYSLIPRMPIALALWNFSNGFLNSAFFSLVGNKSCVTVTYNMLAQLR
jgi:hypothetical protein